ncbi:hypothetical protein AB0G20_22815 [Streptomyces sp. NPDC024017]|uniref:hypothetical protein n=1 Tax=Streptomyces sp. NPDC024017 TaxID=3154326 RepID=UPI0033EC6079
MDGQWFRGHEYDLAAVLEAVDSIVPTCVRGQTGFAAQLAKEAVVEPGTVFL